ncbi:MAG: COP23 domain-containing protein [Microcystaceae cyanobacterium]
MMSNLSLSLSLPPVLIASLVSLSPSVAWSQTAEMSKLQFICQSEQTPPTTVAQMDGGTEVLVTWYSEYLLKNTSPAQICQEVAQTLQNRYERQQPSLFAYEKSMTHWDVCLVSKEGQICTEDEVLFSLNDKYHHEPTNCILANKPPPLL